MSFEKEKELLEKNLTKTTLELIKTGENFNSRNPPSNKEDAELDGKIKAKHLHEFFVEKVFKKLKSLEGKVASLEKEIETLKAAQAASAANTGTP